MSQSSNLYSTSFRDNNGALHYPGKVTKLARYLDILHFRSGNVAEFDLEHFAACSLRVRKKEVLREREEKKKSLADGSHSHKYVGADV